MRFDGVGGDPGTRQNFGGIRSAVLIPGQRLRYYVAGTARIVLGVILIVVGIFGLLLFFLGIILIIIGALLVWSGMSAGRQAQMNWQLQQQQAQLAYIAGQQAAPQRPAYPPQQHTAPALSLIHISEPTRP